MKRYKTYPDKIVFSCGCEFKRQKKDRTRIVFPADSHNDDINFDCTATYQMLSEGITQGTFQICSPLGTQWTKKVLPTELDHLSDLGSILRPGALESKDSNGLSTTVHYERRKNNKEELKLYHPIVDEILKDSYGCLIFQEQSMKIAERCAGFNLQEADILRRGIGHKEPETIAKCKRLFLKKGKEFGVLTEKQLEEVFSWIEASQRYQFNRSHSLSYAITTYITGYIKCHQPVEYYKEWLRISEKREDYAGLINEAKLFDIYVHCPDIRELRPEFYAKGRNIYFGLSDIKGILAKDLQYLAERFTALAWDGQNLGKSISWLQFLSQVLENVSSRTVEGFIGAGALDCFGLDRAVLLYEYERYCRLSPGEKKSLQNEPDIWDDASLLDYVKYIIVDEETHLKEKIAKYEKAVLKRQNSTRTYKTTLTLPEPNQRLDKLRVIAEELQSPLYKIVDTVDSIVYAEENLLGVALTRHKTDEILACVETANCLEILNGRLEYSVLKVKIESARLYQCKVTTEKGNSNMCFLTVSDKSSTMPAICFSDQFSEYRHLLTQSNLVFISGQMGKQGTFIINKVYGI